MEDQTEKEKQLNKPIEQQPKEQQKQGRDKQQDDKKRERVVYEYPIVLSPDFKEVLTRILQRGKSNVAARLIEWENDDAHKFDMSYIDRTKDDDVVTFLQSNRVGRHIEQGGTLQDNIFELRGRAETRIGRLIRRIFGTRFNQESIEKFVNKYKATIREEEVLDRFELVHGEDIKKWYHQNTYAERRGSLGGSCMQYPACQRYFGIYVKNPEKVGLLILKNEKGDKILGRAIVWHMKEPENIILMDRVYVSDDANVNLYTQYAKREGWATLARQGYGGTSIVLANGEKMDKIRLIVELDDTKFDRYPYMDTLRYYYEKHKIISSVQIKEYGTLKTLNDTGGYYLEYGHRGWGDDEDYEPPMVEDYHGNDILEDEAVWCDYDDVYCHQNEAIRVHKGENGRGKWFIPDSKFLVFSEYGDGYYHKDDVVYSDYMKDWVYDKYAVKMYFDKDKKQKPSWMHKLLVHDEMGKVGDDYFLLDLLYRDQIKDGNKIIPGDYHFIDEEFENLPQEEEEDEYFKYVPSGVNLDESKRLWF